MVMRVIRPHQRMCNLMKDRVPDVRLGIQQRKFPAQRDRASAIFADTEPANRPVKLKVPMGKAVSGQQPAGKCFGVFENHRIFAWACLRSRKAGRDFPPG
jgi:hypothetical protein